MSNRDLIARRYEMALGFSRPASHVIISTLAEQPIEEIMADLREKDPRAAQLLGEHIVPGDGDATADGEGS